MNAYSDGGHANGGGSNGDQWHSGPGAPGQGAFGPGWREHSNMGNGKPRVYFVGSHGTGKTTLARYVSERFHLPVISEVARSILAEMEVSLDQIRSNLDTVNRYQYEVCRRQIREEMKAGGGFVSDRAFCNLAYAAEHSTIMGDLARDPGLKRYMDWVAGGLVFFVRPHPDLVKDDGVRRGLAWEDVVRVDGMVKLLLELYAIPYVTISTLSMQERVRLVDEVLGLRFPELVEDAKPHFVAPDLNVADLDVAEGRERPADGLPSAKKPRGTGSVWSDGPRGFDGD